MGSTEKIRVGANWNSEERIAVASAITAALELLRLEEAQQREMIFWEHPCFAQNKARHRELVEMRTLLIHASGQFLDRIRDMYKEFID